MAAPQKVQPLRPKNQKEAALWLVASEEFKWWCLLNGFKWAQHHQVLGEHLQKVANGEITRLAILLPRGSAKSTYSSILFPGFYLARNPKHCILAGSHTQELADNFGRKARNYVGAKGPCIGLDLSPDSQAASRWSTVQGGEYFGVGVGGSVVGRRGDLALLDDLLSGAEDADSKLIRDKVWDWLMFDLLPCLKPGARVVLVNNRWHEDDVAGRLFDPKNEHYDAKEAAKWTVLSIPLVAETEPDPLGRKIGELMWPEYYNWDMVEGFKRDSRVWNALYQQRPAPDAGNFFQKEWLQGYAPSELPKNLRYYLASDHAVSSKQAADKTCLLPVGVCENGFIWVLPDTQWGRFNTEETVDKALALIAKIKPLTWWAEKGHISQSIGPFLRKRMRERCIYTNIEEVTPTKNKRQRAQAIHGRMAMGMVKFPKFAPWWPDAEYELLSFRGEGDTHDDFCLTGNTLIAMADGTHKRLRNVDPGDLVATPFGPREVLAKQLTSEWAQRFRVKFSNGAVLEATGNHPILTNRGFCNVDSLTTERVGCIDTFVCVEELRKPKLLSIADTVTGVIPIRGTPTTETIFTGPNPTAVSCTGTSGRMNMGLFRRAWTFITRMATRAITTLGTFGWSVEKSILGFTGFLPGAKPRNTCNTWRIFGRELPLGTNRQSDGRGTENTGGRRGKTGFPYRQRVWSVALSSKHSSRPVRVAVGSSVSVVPTVELVSRKSMNPGPVFNLSVEGSVFYANGILTHNCDALAHMGMGLERITSAAPKRQVSRENRPKPFTGEWLNQSEERQKRRERMEAAMAGW